MSRGVAAGAVLLAAAALACAQASRPSGGEPDRVSPRVVSVFPLPFDTLEDLDAPVVIEFDERLSMRLEGLSSFDDAVLVSPATGEVEVDRYSRSLEISVEGGWRAGLVYRVVVLPGIRDLFNNVRREPVELVFSTGAPIPPTAVAGFIEDRLTGQPVVAARVRAVRRVDSVAYVAVSDTGGFFSLRNIPAGAYDVAAWLDRNRDRDPDFQEPQDRATLPLGYQDTLVLPMALLPMDTTPARLVRAEPVDSTRIRISFDDYFAPGPVAGRASIFLLPDTTYVTAGPLMHSTALDSLLARERAVRDSLRMVQDSIVRARQDSIRQAAADSLALLAPPDSLPPDSLPRDTTAGDPAPPPRVLALPPGAQGAPGREAQRRDATPGRPGTPAIPRPSRDLIVRLLVPLRPGTSYMVEVSGVVNIREVPGGGGSAPFRMPARADTVRLDTIPAVPPDTAGP